MTNNDRIFPERRAPVSALQHAIDQYWVLHRGWPLDTLRKLVREKNSASDPKLGPAQIKALDRAGLLKFLMQRTFGVQSTEEYLRSERYQQSQRQQG